MQIMVLLNEKNKVSKPIKYKAKNKFQRKKKEYTKSRLVE